MEKTYVFENKDSNSNLMAMLAPLMQRNGLDPNLLLTMNRNGGCFGEGFMWIIFLFFLMGWNGNGNGFGFGGRGCGGGAYGLANEINNNFGRDLLMQAINGNNQAVNSLASNLNCSVGQVQNALNSLCGQVQNVGSQLGMSSQQIINSVISGNNGIAQAIADCCCKTQNSITTQGYESQLAICNQTNTLVNTANANTLSIRDGANANTNAILSKLDSIQTQNLQDKIEALREKNTALSSQLSNEHQTASIIQSQMQSVQPLQTALCALQKEVDNIKCALPTSVTVPYSPVVPVPNCAYYQAYGALANGGFWG